MTDEFTSERITLDGDMTIDEGGWMPLDAGAAHYNAAMECQAEEEHEQRIAHFRAAEEMYLLSAMCGNAIAYLNLGYVYSYDRCEGDYSICERDDLGPTFFGAAYAENQPGDQWHPTRDQLDTAAYYCFSKAAVSGDAEALYKQGDMEMAGRGCDKHERHAFDLYQEAYEASRELEPVLWGSAALRIAGCYEKGTGCKCDLAKALEWYEIAEAGLEAAVNAGDWFYKRALRDTTNGAKRMRQELSGEY